MLIPFRGKKPRVPRDKNPGGSFGKKCWLTTKKKMLFNNKKE